MLVPWSTRTSIHTPQPRQWWKLPERLPEKAKENGRHTGSASRMHCPEASKWWFCAARAGIFSPWHMGRSKRHNLLWVGKSQHKKGTSVHIRKHAGPGGTLDGPSIRYITIKRTLPRHPESNFSGQCTYWSFCFPSPCCPNRKKCCLQYQLHCSNKQLWVYAHMDCARHFG